jgi:predicted amidohydrolase
MESKASDKVSNLAKIEAFVQEAANQSVNLIIFPECCITGYWFIRKLNAEQLRDLAEPIFTGSSSQHIIRLAQKYDLGIGAGLIEDNGSGHFYNSYIVVFPNGEMYCHRKLHALNIL